MCYTYIYTDSKDSMARLTYVTSAVVLRLHTGLSHVDVHGFLRVSTHVHERHSQFLHRAGEKDANGYTLAMFVINIH